MTDNLNTHADYIISHKLTALENMYDDLNRMSDGITSNNLFSRFSENSNPDVHQQLYLELDRLLISIEKIFPDFEGITMINEKGYLYYYDYSFDSNKSAFDIIQSDWFQALENTHTPQISMSHTRDYSRNDKDEAVYSFVLSAWDNKLRTSSYIIIDFKSDLISEILNQNTDDAYIAGSLIYGREGYVVPHADSSILPFDLVEKEKSGSTIAAKDEEQYLIFKKSIPHMNWWIVEYFSINNLYKPVFDMKLITYSTIIISVFVCIFASLFVSHRISSPIHRMRRKMYEIEKGNFEEEFITNSKDEIGELANGFNHMLTQIKQLIHSVTLQEKLKKQAEITALQLQINPHFIYNTLESINSLARKNKEIEISRLIVLLGRLLRLSISSFEEEVQIKQEMTYTKYYLEIQRFRMRNQLDYELNIDPEIENHMTVKWILQPIVENAVVHGLDPLGYGKITITGYQEEETIIFSVTDNGIGIDPLSLEKIQQQLQYKSEELTKYKRKVGIFNVQTRLKLHYGPSYGVSIDSDLGKGSYIKIIIPKVAGGKNA